MVLKGFLKGYLMKKKDIFSAASILGLVVLLFSCSSNSSQSSEEVSSSPQGNPVILFQVSIPIDAADTSQIKIAGSFNSWDPWDEASVLNKIGSRLYEIELEFEPSFVQTTIEYKYVLILEGQDDNGWTNVEGSLTGGEISNRHYVVKAGAQTVNDTVLSFKNNTGQTSVTRGSLHIVTLDMPQYTEGRQRKIRIWVPDGYDAQDTTKTYPVLYMHDGQNLFDSYTSFSGEWRIDEAIGSLMDGGYDGTIVVGIDNSIDRLNELSPSWPRSSVGNPVITDPSGEKYAAFIVETVKPYVDAHFHTNPSRETTGIGGSSMGGVMSFFMAMTYPNVFSYAMLFSPAMQVYADQTSENFVQDLDFSNTDLLPRLYIYSGGTVAAPGTIPTGESTITPYVGIIRDALLDNDYPSAKIMTHTDPTKGHNEAAWATYFPIAYSWLLDL